MFSHIYYGVSDFERAYAFYSKLMTCLTIKERFMIEISLGQVGTALVQTAGRYSLSANLLMVKSMIKAMDK